RRGTMTLCVISRGIRGPSEQLCKPRESRVFWNCKIFRCYHSCDARNDCFLFGSGLSTGCPQRRKELWKGLAEGFFRLVPERIHLRQVRLARRLPALAQLLLDVVKAIGEAPQRAAQRFLGMDLHPAAEVRGCEE